MRFSPLSPRALVAITAAAALSAGAHAQFTYSASNITSDVNFGNQNESSYASDFTDPQASTALSSGTVGSSDMYDGNNYGYTYHGVGSASTTSLITGGGLKESFSDASQVQQLTGGNSYVGPAAQSWSGADITFSVSTAGSYAFIADGTITTALNNNDYSFIGTLTDTTTHTQILAFTVAAAAASLNPVNTNVNLAAGDNYELSFYTVSYDVTPAGAGLSAVQAGAFNGRVQIGTPSSTPEPATLTFAAATAIGVLRKRRAKRAA